VNRKTKKCLVSSCLVGLCTRYDGRSKPNPDCIRALADFCYIPVCPEQLGGLATPRPPADIVGGDGKDVLQNRARVVRRDGIDVTEQFVAGARAVLQIARDQDVTLALLKARSPSCGLQPRIGVAAALLRQSGITVIEY
jgi:uncharacterized protein YbbK (DUF523 family)